MGRSYAVKIENYSADEIRKLLDKHISKEKTVLKLIAGQHMRN